MGIRRLARLIIARRWIVLIAALGGAVAVGAWARTHNSEARPLFEAVATVSFSSTDSRGDRSVLVDQLAAAADVAKTANSEVIATGRARVTIDDRTGELRMAALSNQEQEAVETATQMGEAYFRASAEQAEAAEQARSSEIVAEATALLDRLDELQPDDPVEPPVSTADQARLDFLSLQVEALTQASSQATVDLILAEMGSDNRGVGSPEEIREELDLIESRLNELYIEIAELNATGVVPSGRRNVDAPTATSTVPRDTSNTTSSNGVELDWTIEAIQQRLDELQDEYASLFVAGDRGTIDENSPTVDPVTVTDMTDPRFPIALFAAIGLIGGGLVAVGASLAESQLRGRLFVGPDMPRSQLLAEVPSWRRTLAQSQRRFPGVASKPRRLASKRFDGVKSLRQSVVGFNGHSDEPEIIGLGGANLDHGEVEALALDLALSMAATDRTVMLLDLDFRSKPAVIGDGSGPSVANIVDELRQNGGGNATDLSHAFLEVVPIAPRLRMITSGTPSREGSELVLTSSFERMLEGARREADIVLAITPQVTDPDFPAVGERLNGVVAVGRVTKTRRKDLEPVLISGRLLGWVLVTNWRRPSHKSALPSRVLRRKSELG